MINQAAVERRNYWIEEIVRLSGNFGADSTRVHEELTDEIRQSGHGAILDHLRLCGAIPESYEHDSSEEKLYSKYTDSLLSCAFNHIGLRSLVLAERADAADVEAATDEYSFVADAKVFRLSRTAKNQKDFKVQAMDGWKRGRPFAMIVSPLYQLPARSSQIYEQAARRNVCVFSYAHLSVLVGFAEEAGPAHSMKLLNNIFEMVGAMNPSKSAVDYWQAINRTMLNYCSAVSGLWQIEKQANYDALIVAKEHALEVLSKERDEILRMTRDAAIQRLIYDRRINSKIATISTVSDNNLLSAA